MTLAPGIAESSANSAEQSPIAEALKQASSSGNKSWSALFSKQPFHPRRNMRKLMPVQ